jgi:pimeloyl-ACP methyl ester carboxylesterase
MKLIPPVPGRQGTWSDRSVVPAIGILAGALLAASATFVHLQSRRAEKLHPPAGRFIEVDGVRLHYVEKGLGTPLLLIHGVGVTLDDFAASRLMDRLSEHHRVLAFDRPGYGYSDRPGGQWTAAAQAELLCNACTALGVDRTAVVGHSWGTLVALEMALRFPQYVSGLVLLSGYYFPSPRIDSLILAMPAIPIVGTAMRHTVSPLLGRPLTVRMTRRMFAPDSVSHAFASAMPLAFRLRPAQLRAAAQDAGRMIAAASTLSPRYGQVECPVKILAGAADQVVQFEGQSQRLASVLMHGEMEVIPRAGHMLHYSDPDRVVKAVEHVLQRSYAM